MKRILITSFLILPKICFAFGDGSYSQIPNPEPPLRKVEKVVSEPIIKKDRSIVDWHGDDTILVDLPKPKVIIEPPVIVKHDQRIVVNSKPAYADVIEQMCDDKSCGEWQ